MDTLDREILETIASQCRKPLEEVRPDTSIFKELAQDSLAIVEMIMALEQRFNVTIHDNELERLANVADLTRHIRRLASRELPPS